MVICCLTTLLSASSAFAQPKGASPESQKQEIDSAIQAAVDVLHVNHDGQVRGTFATVRRTHHRSTSAALKDGSLITGGCEAFPL